MPCGDDPERRREVGPPGSGWAEEHDTLRFQEESSRRETRDLLPGRGLPVPVVVREIWAEVIAGH